MHFGNFFVSIVFFVFQRDALPIGSFVPFQLKKDMHLCPRPEQLTSEQTAEFDQRFEDQVMEHSRKIC